MKHGRERSHTRNPVLPRHCCTTSDDPGPGRRIRDPRSVALRNDAVRTVAVGRVRICRSESNVYMTHGREPSYRRKPVLHRHCCTPSYDPGRNAQRPRTDGRNGQLPPYTSGLTALEDLAPRPCFFQHGYVCKWGKKKSRRKHFLDQSLLRAVCLNLRGQLE